VIFIELSFLDWSMHHSCDMMLARGFARSWEDAVSNYDELWRMRVTPLYASLAPV
jgi:hypothetical protein